MKICIVTTSLGLGGAEKAAALQSIMLTKLGYEVHIVLISNIIVFDYKGTIYNLGELKDKNNSLIGKIKRTLLFRKYLKKENFDFIIDNRMRSNSLLSEYVISKYVYSNLRIIYVLHLNDFPSKIKKHPIILKTLYRAFKIITVSNHAKCYIENTYKFKNVKTIYNTFSNSIENKSKDKIADGLTFKYILYHGRLLDSHKNLKFLIGVYNKSLLPKEKIKLVFLGEGEDEQMLKDETKYLKCSENVIFLPFTDNPYPYIKNALFTVLASHFEGFPLSLIESLACGTPIVSVDCKTGPSEIIINNYNGLLVKPNNMDAFLNALNLMITKMPLEVLSINAKKTSSKFSQKQIAISWKQVLETQFDNVIKA